LNSLLGRTAWALKSGAGCCTNTAMGAFLVSKRLFQQFNGNHVSLTQHRPLSA
jgi:hypothetical protein